MYSLIARAILEVYDDKDSEKVSQSSVTCKWHYKKALFFYLISKPCKSKGLHFIESL